MQELIEKGEALGRLLPPITFTLMELVADNNPSEIVQVCITSNIYILTTQKSFTFILELYPIRS
jgi:hypothetical protein